MSNNNPIPNNKPFKKGQSGNPKGRPPKLVSFLNKELQKEGFEPVSNAHVIDAYRTLLNLPLSKIVNIASKETDEYPMLYKLVAKELTGKRGAEMLGKLLDRAYGRPSQSIELRGSRQIIVTNRKSED